MISDLSKHYNSSFEHIKNSHIYLAQLGWGETCSAGQIYENYRDIYVVIFVSSGCGKLIIKGQTILMQKNCIFCIPPNVKATMIADNIDPWHQYYFNFGGAFADDLIGQSVFKNGNYRAVLDDDTIAQIIRDSAMEIRNHPHPELYGLETLFKLLNFITTDGSNEKEDVRKQYISAAKDYIQEHYAKAIHIGNIAKNLNISRSYLYQLFMDQMGISPKEYISRTRIQRAQYLLANTDLPIRIISLNVGFNSYAPFFLMFQRVTELTPGEYRLLQSSDKNAVELNCNTTIRIFLTIDECKKLEPFVQQTLTQEDDPDFVNEIPKETYLKRLSYEAVSYDLFAYCFQNNTDAENYYRRAAKAEPRHANSGFRIDNIKNITQLTVWHENRVYKLLGKDIVRFNQFRHFLNTITGDTIYDQ